jgi:N-acetyl-anhydromuramyl-L-alanine amidase AmpD
MNIEFIGCSKQNFRRGRPEPYRPEAIVIHIMAGRLRTVDAWFQDARAVVSAHYGIGRQGEVHQYVREEDTAFHVGVVDDPAWPGIKLCGGTFVNPNYYTIGIEHEGFAHCAWPETQRASSAELIAQVAARWHIPVDAVHIVRHHDIRRSKSCPGPAAPIGELIERAARLIRLEPRSGSTE